MKDDYSQIGSADCYIITDDSTIIGKTGDSYDRYTFIGDKWLLTREYDSNYTQYEDYNCIDLNTLSSKNAGFAPIYLFIAFSFAILVLYFVWYILGKGLFKREI